MTLPLAGAKVRASDLATVFPLNTDAWTDYTPTWTQSATISKTINYARYTKVGRTVHVRVSMTATTSGTAANPIVCSLPVAPAIIGVANIDSVGAGVVRDASVGNYPAVVVLNTGSNVLFMSTAGGFLGQTTMTAAIVSGDVLTFEATYEAAS